ncbi:MAG: CNNM domain-containing protein [Acidimicrobiales bacterium]
MPPEATLAAALRYELMTVLDVGLVVTLIALVAALFVLAMVEASLLHSRRSAVAAAAAAGDLKSKRLLVQLDELPVVMNTVLLIVLLVQVTCTALAGLLAQRWFGGTGITIATLGVTAVLFIYGEAIPKTLALADPIRHARRFSPMVAALTVAVGPAVTILVKIASWQSPQTDSADTFNAVSERELRHLTDEAAAAGEIEPSDAELIEKSFTLGDLQIADIMIPLGDVVSVPTSATVHSALRTAIDSGHRRLIVHDRSPDRVVGFALLRDLADASSSDDDASTASHVRTALTFAPDELVIDVLREMQRERCNLVLVVEPDDATLGMVTVEDIVEELLGDIDDPRPRNDRRN